MFFCSVCKKECYSNYCPKCGQKKLNKKINLKNLLSDFFDNIFALEKSIFSSIKLLIIKPDKLIKNYLNGYRNYYISPGKLFVLSSILIAFAFTITENNFLIISIGKSSLQSQFLFLIILILMSSFSTYLTYYLEWKKKFIEHLIINIYNISFWTIIFLPISIINSFYIDYAYVSEILLLLYIIVIMIWNNRIFEIKILWKKIIYITISLFLFLLIGYVFTLMK